MANDESPIDVSKLTYEGIVNDGTPRSMALLLCAKALFKGELAMMPEDYIAALVFDAFHETLVVLDDTPLLLGAITFRPFRELGFVEIAFVAVNNERASRGIGGAMMSRLKEWMRRRRIYHILTCADNDAVGFFRKQGYHDLIVLRKESYVGIIKEYQRVVLMECILHPSINYLHTRRHVVAQAFALLDVVAAVSSDQLPPTRNRRRPVGFRLPEGSPTVAATAAATDLKAVQRDCAMYADVLSSVRARCGDTVDLRHVIERLALDPGTPYYITPYIFAADCRRAFTEAKRRAGGDMSIIERIDSAESLMLRLLGDVYGSWRARVNATRDE
eukprot:TRINITY_DN36055_c0_g1_i1.p1 TRINITY_DN36055_c0_g1~~TRINITY_DN36055_c0_g1_i1.p1  ORF type:complete len:331 (-),score=54.70 TRINITY_DN36055_c0_g1_i1:215-1207(-)